MRARLIKVCFFLCLVPAILALPVSARAQDTGQPSAAAPSPAQVPPEQGTVKIVLSHATMCEKVESLAPVRQAVVFSASVGQVYCFTSFDPVSQPTLIYHRWYHHDELSTQTRLRLYPPRWATYSVIQLRETDKGPWRVEITDQNGRVFDTLRFSITD
jgi:hypothetical protein